MKKLTVGSCFSGIGGLELGLEWTGGFETKWQIENDEYASRVLAKHWPNVKRYGDITTIGGGELEPVDVICGGFPCQDVSTAGKKEGLQGKRTTLWSELYRLICQIRPRWFIGENVPGLFSTNDGKFFEYILRDLAKARYDVVWQTLRASDVGANHSRERVFIIANVQGFGFREGEEIQALNTIERIFQKSKWDKTGFLTRTCRGNSGRIYGIPSSFVFGEHDGVRSELDINRIKCLGNAVVPQVAQKIGEMILERERLELVK